MKKATGYEIFPPIPNYWRKYLGGSPFNYITTLCKN